MIYKRVQLFTNFCALSGYLIEINAGMRFVVDFNNLRDRKVGNRIILKFDFHCHP